MVTQLSEIEQQYQVILLALTTIDGPTIWNSLPDNVTLAPSLSTFRQRLNTFPASFRDIITDPG